MVLTDDAILIYHTDDAILMIPLFHTDDTMLMIRY